MIGAAAGSLEGRTMKNKDKDIKQKVKEYMEIMGIYAPDDQEAADGHDNTSEAGTGTEGGE